MAALPNLSAIAGMGKKKLLLMKITLRFFKLILLYNFN
jgi:hypothetical protein